MFNTALNEPLFLVLRNVCATVFINKIVVSLFFAFFENLHVFFFNLWCQEYFKIDVSYLVS